MVTGAARGIGRAIAEHLHHAGARVVVIDKDECALKERYDGEAGYEWIAHDFSQTGDGQITTEEALVRKIIGRTGTAPTLIVNNVGAGSDDSFFDLNGDTYDELHRVNFRTPLFFTQRLVGRLAPVIERRPPLPHERAAILFISSVHDHVVVHRPAYSTSKAAVAQLTRELAVTLGGYGIRVNAISPGWIRTDPNPESKIQRAKEQYLVPQIAAGRPGRPEDVASLAVTLLSNSWSGYVTGVNVPVDGGLSLGTWMQPPGIPWPLPAGERPDGYTLGDLEGQWGVTAAQDHPAQQDVGGGEEQDDQFADQIERHDHSLSLAAHGDAGRNQR